MIRHMVYTILCEHIECIQDEVTAANCRLTHTRYCPTLLDDVGFLWYMNIIAKKDLNMGNHWMYAMSPTDRKSYTRANFEKKMTMLMKLVNNGNLTMQQMMTILT